MSDEWTNLTQKQHVSFYWIVLRDLFDSSSLLSHLQWGVCMCLLKWRLPCFSIVTRDAVKEIDMLTFFTGSTTFHMIYHLRTIYVVHILMEHNESSNQTLLKKYFRAIKNHFYINGRNISHWNRLNGYIFENGFQSLYASQQAHLPWRKHTSHFQALPFFVVAS